MCLINPSDKNTLKDQKIYYKVVERSGRREYTGPFYKSLAYKIGVVSTSNAIKGKIEKEVVYGIHVFPSLSIAKHYKNWLCEMFWLNKGFCILKVECEASDFIAHGLTELSDGHVIDSSVFMAIKPLEVVNENNDN